MGDKSRIEWTDATWNPVTGCTRVSEGCRNCYMARTVPRFWQDPWKVVLHPDRLDHPIRWKRPRRIFVNSLSDLFHEDVPDRFIEQVFGVMCTANWHTYQVLTKRPKRMLDWISRSAYLVNDPPKNVWLGVSIENQATADERIPLLLQTPAAVRFVSAEPLLGPVSFRWAQWEPFSRDRVTNHLDGLRRLDWIIVGGESGPGARPCDVAWIRSIKDECKAAGVSCFVKQLGGYVDDRNDAGFEGDELAAWPMDTDTSDRDNEWSYQGARIRIRLKDRKGGDWNEWPEDLRVREFPQWSRRC